MKILVKRAIFAAILIMAGSGAKADSTPPEPAKIAPTGQRFLFVVETSSQSRRFEAANRQAIFDLIMNGVFGQMRTGDSFGLWTYNDEVHAGSFPMTTWDAEKTLETAGRVAGYLQKQKYVREPDSGKLVANLRQLSDQVGDFNVFIVSTGRNPMNGTPFDERVNTAYDVYAQRPGPLTKLPLITSFAVRKGRPVRASVVLAGEKITLPERPPSVAQETKKTGESTNTTARSLDLEKDAASSVVTTQSQPIATPAAVASMASTNATATSTTNTSRPVRKVMQIITKTNGAPAVITTLGGATNVPLASTTDIEKTAAMGITTNSVTPSATSPMATIPSSQLVTSAVMKASSTSAQAAWPNDPSTAAPPIATSELSVRTAFSIVSSSLSSNTVVPASASGLEAPRLPVNPPSVETPVVGSPRTDSSGSRLFPSAPLTVMARERTESSARGPQPALTATATAVPSQSGLSAGVLLAIGGVLLGAASFLLVLVLRRGPTPDRGSLITQSMGRAPDSH